MSGSSRMEPAVKKKKKKFRLMPGIEPGTVANCAGQSAFANLTQFTIRLANDHWGSHLINNAPSIVARLAAIVTCESSSFRC